MKLQKMVIQDANRKNWINFWYSIDETTYTLDKGFLVSYKLGMEYNTIFLGPFSKLFIRCPSDSTEDVWIKLRLLLCSHYQSEMTFFRIHHINN